MRKVRKATTPKTNAIPHHNPRCMVCKHPQSAEILKEKMMDVAHKDLAEKYFPNTTLKTVLNSFTTHFNEHVNPDASLALLPTVLPATRGVPLAYSTQRVFDAGAKKKINAQFNYEKTMELLAEKINHLEDEFMSMHLQTKCDHCGRSADKDRNLAKMLSVIDRFLHANGEWVKIKNPKAVMKFLFDSTFLRFVNNMMAIYTSTLQEKGLLARQAVNEFSEGKISHQLLLRRIAEIEDMGSAVLAEKAIVELRAIQEHINKEFGKTGWGGGDGSTS